MTTTMGAGTAMPDHRPRRGRRWRLAELPEYLEATAATVLCAVLATVLPAIAVLGLMETIRDRNVLGACVPALILLVTLVLEVQCLFLVGRALLHEPLPFGPAVARHHPRWPALLRPIIGLYWLCHFLLGALLAHGLHRATDAGLGSPWLMMGIVFAFTAAANVYLSLFVGTFDPSSPWIGRLWRARFLLDVAVTVAAYLTARAAAE